MFHNQNLGIASLLWQRKCFRHVFKPQQHTQYWWKLDVNVTPVPHRVPLNCQRVLWLVGLVCITIYYSYSTELVQWKSIVCVCVYSNAHISYFSLNPKYTFLLPKILTRVLIHWWKESPTSELCLPVAITFFYKLQQQAVWKKYWAFFKAALIPFSVGTNGLRAETMNDAC